MAKAGFCVTVGQEKCLHSLAGVHFAGTFRVRLVITLICIKYQPSGCIITWSLTAK